MVLNVDRGERRDALLNTARKMFLAHGYDGTSIERVIASAGGSKANLYHYFGSKKNLFREALSVEIERLVDLRIPLEDDGDIAATLMMIGRRYTTTMLKPQRVALFRLMQAEAERFPDVATDFFEIAIKRKDKELGYFLERQVARGRLAFPITERAVSQFFALLLGEPHVRAMLGLKPFRSGDSLGKHVHEAVRLFLHGFL